MDIPNFEENIFSRKSSDTILVIPVINEGEKIRTQILNIKKLNFGIDIVISDGGSTDKSLDLSFLKENGVRSLLTKKDIGKLSSQLRIAYFWSLKEGYTKIITIDGNGKDGVSNITRIKKKLDEGYDYVQGSRYIKGGIAKNTPLDRFFLGRFLHAPIISIASRKRFTDTTNGFRGYSKSFLIDERVMPFRKIFSNYELLFYLTVRAGQLNFRVCEVPVTRNYPRRGPVPTKINGFLSKLEILKESILAGLGFYNP